MYGPEFLREAQRQLSVCNACRYCEGFCAVFPALELRSEIRSGDLTYLANLCHDCRDCYTACMFIPPHEFAVNIPQVFAEARVRTYEHYGWPRVLARLVRHSAAGTAALALAGIAAVWLAIVVFLGPGTLGVAHRGPGAFYAVAPYLAILIPALIVTLYGICVVAAGAREFLHDIAGPAPPESGPAGAPGTAGASESPGPSEPRSPGPPGPRSPAAAWQAARDALVLRYLGGGGAGCYYPKRRGSFARRTLHHAVVWGFLAALASTTIAAIEQELFGILPPFPILSLPVLFGIAGGVLLILGTTGLLALKAGRDRAPDAAAMAALDYAFLILLDLVAITGMLLLILRETRAMPPMLVVHLGLLVGLFLTAPYGKAVHAVYRYLALVKRAGEERLEAP